MVSLAALAIAGLSLGVLADPVFWQGVGSVALLGGAIQIGRVLLGAYVKTPEGRQVGQVMANLLETAEPIVNALDASGLPPAHRAKIARDQIEAELKAQGIEGDAQALARQYIPQVIEMALQRVRAAAEAAKPAAS